MAADSPAPAPPPILRLPAELRREIFLSLFRSTTIIPDRPRYHGHDPERGCLSVLSVCRQFYHEAAPLALPNVTVFCDTNASVAEALHKMGPAQVAQLRHLVVLFVPVGFPLLRKSKSAGWDPADGGIHGNQSAENCDSSRDGDVQEEGGSGWDNDDPTLWEDDDDEDSDVEDDPSDSDDDDDDDGNDDGNDNDNDADDRREDWGNGVPKYVRHFHLGAILGLFPGLQLDLLEVYCGTGGGPVTSEQVLDCFGSLLEADGYREVWMEAANGDGEWNGAEMPSMRRWKKAFDTRFKPYGGKVRFQLQDYDWKYWDTDPFWTRSRKAGFTLTKAPKTDGDDDDEDYDRGKYEGLGHASEDTAGIVLKRGDTADIVVKADGRRVLRCVEQDRDGNSKSYFKKASDALRKLFSEKDWDSIKAMKGFDNGDLTEMEGGGNQIYMYW